MLGRTRLILVMFILSWVVVVPFAYNEGISGGEAAHAYGVQYHTTNAIKHGCPIDPGCLGANDYAGDYVRVGYNRHTVDGQTMGQSWVSVNDYPWEGGAQHHYDSCWGCVRGQVVWDTNPDWECRFATNHVVSNPDVDSHMHYTESAIC